MNGSQKRAGQFVVACRDSSELFELAHKAFDTVASPVQFLVVRDLLQAITPRWDDWLYLLSAQFFTDLVAVVGFVHYRCLNRASLRHLRENPVEHGSVVLLSWRQHDSDGCFFVRGRQVDLGSETAATASQALLGLAPFFAAAPAACW